MWHAGHSVDKTETTGNMCFVYDMVLFCIQEDWGFCTCTVATWVQLVWPSWEVANYWGCMIGARGNTSLPAQFCKSCEYLSCLWTVSCGLWVHLKSYGIGGVGPSDSSTNQCTIHPSRCTGRCWFTVASEARSQLLWSCVMSLNGEKKGNVFMVFIPHDCEPCHMNPHETWFCRCVLCECVLWSGGEAHTMI